MNLNDLPAFGDVYLQYFNPQRQQFELRRKSRAEGNLSISECMDLLEKLMRKHQLSFVPNKLNPNLILFPFCFIEPSKGDQILNTVTKEVYTVDQTIKNPITNQWEGVVKFNNLITPPSVEHRHTLQYLDPSKYIKFEHEYPEALLNKISANSEGILTNIPQIVPTITWTLLRVEPGGLGEPFGPRRELKSSLRESVKDPLVPGHTVEIRGQSFDNIVEFSGWGNSHRTCERLITWFEQLIKLYSGYLRHAGISQLFFWKREREAQKTAWRQQLPVTSTQFYFRTEELEAVYQRDILKIDISIGTSEKYVPYTNQVRYIADQLVSGNYTPQEYRDLFYRSGEYLFGNIDIRQ